MKYDPAEFEHLVETMRDDHNENFKKLLIEIVKDAYIDNTLRELETLIKELQCLFTDNSDN